MAYTPENNPYIPGDPYSYDLKWQVDKINHLDARFANLDEAIQNATDEALISEGYARGTQEGETVGPDSPYYENNSKYFSEKSSEFAGDASDEADRSRDEADDAHAKALVSEGYASGTQDGVPVTSGPYFEHNSKYYMEEAADYAANIGDPVSGIVVDWLDDHITQPTTPIVDTSLSIAGAAADSEVVGDRFTEDEAVIEGINTAVSRYVAPDVSLITVDGKLYNVNNWAEYLTNDGSYFEYPIDPITYPRKIRITGTTGGWSMNYYPLVCFYDEDRLPISKFGLASTTYTDEELDIPSNCRSIVVNYYNAYDLYFEISEIGIGTTARTNGKIFYSILSDEIFVSTRFNATKDFVVDFKKKGGNDLPDFGIFYVNDNVDYLPSEDLSNLTNILMQGSDWHGPMIVRTVNNQDGDNPNSHYWTGGNHQYNNQGTGSTATARCTSLKFYIDDDLLTGGSGYCDRIRIEWINMIQSYSTTKADGSGREVIKELHTLIFDGVKWETYTRIIALEDLIFEEFYGFQYGGNGSIFPKVRYVGGTNRGEYIAHDGSSCGDKTCFRMEGYGSTYAIDLELDPLLDLGKREHYTGHYGMFSTTYGKNYTHVIGDEATNNANYHVDSGEMIAVRGWYRFHPAD